MLSVKLFIVLVFNFLNEHYFKQVRIQTTPLPKPGEEPLFRGTLDCLRKTVHNEVCIKYILHSDTNVMVTPTLIH